VNIALALKLLLLAADGGRYVNGQHKLQVHWKLVGSNSWGKPFYGEKGGEAAKKARYRKPATTAGYSSREVHFRSPVAPNDDGPR
jgi:hypothetical protein